MRIVLSIEMPAQDWHLQVRTTSQQARCFIGACAYLSRQRPAHACFLAGGLEAELPLSRQGALQMLQGQPVMQLPSMAAQASCVSC